MIKEFLLLRSDLVVDDKNKGLEWNNNLAGAHTKNEYKNSEYKCDSQVIYILSREGWF